MKKLKKILGYTVLVCFCLNFSIKFNALNVLAEIESEEVIETRIEEYCSKTLGIDRETFEYDQKRDFSSMSYQDIKSEYHEDINKLFAEQISKMIKEVSDDYKLDKMCSDKLAAKRVNEIATTYELSQKGLCRFAVYQFALSQKIDSDQIPEEVMSQKISSLFDTYTAIEDFQNELIKELSFSKDVLQQTLDAYDAMVALYPLHVRLQCIISDLNTFREKLSKLTEVFFYMERYINAASDQVN